MAKMDYEIIKYVIYFKTINENRWKKETAHTEEDAVEIMKELRLDGYDCYCEQIRIMVF